jgi:hypothetical protein
MNLWVLLYDVQGCSNYTHVLMTHLIKYMRNFRCLHHYSQQGWEAWNVVVTFFIPGEHIMGVCLRHGVPVQTETKLCSTDVHAHVGE